MVSDPVDVPRKGYKGSKEPLRRKMYEYNRVAAKVEDYLRCEMAAEPVDTVRSFTNGSIAMAIGEDHAVVRPIVTSIDAGSNGVTIVKGDFQRAMDRKRGS